MHWILHKININDPFTRIPNELLQREDLTYEARGLLTLIHMYANLEQQHLKETYYTSTCREEKLNRILQELQEFSLIKVGLSPQEAKNKCISKEMLGQGQGPLVCSWCHCFTYTLHRHHWPISQQEGGTETVPICPTCHAEYHALHDRLVCLS